MKTKISEVQAINALITEVERKLALAKTCSSYYKGTNHKTVAMRVTQLNTLYKVFGINHLATI